jgi:Family of unknown function (DUF6132)
MPPDIAQSDSVQTEAPVQKGKRRMLLHMVLYVVGGAAVGFGYHKIVGCRSGACPITANPYISTLYGALVGFFAGGGLGR